MNDSIMERAAVIAARLPRGQSMEWVTMGGRYVLTRAGDGSLSAKEGSAPRSLGTRPRRSGPIARPPHWGPPLWKALHAGALERPDPASRLALVEEITRQLPPHCGCRGHWRRLLRESPPVVEDAERFFAWSVAAHNAVRRAKKQPEMPLQAACKLYAGR